MHLGVPIRPRTAVGSLVAALAAVLLAAGVASAAPAPAEPPGPVRDLTLTSQGGQGARTIYLGGSWSQPSETGGGTGLHYTWEVTNALGDRVDAGSTTTPATGRISTDRCTQPFTIAVRAVTQDPATGEPLTGPERTATFGETTCQINSSLSATQTGPGTLRVDIAREQPVDPYVAGDCVLAADGRTVWTGTCGGYDGETAVVGDLAPGTHELVLTTTSPNGHDYVDSTSAVVS